MALKPAPRHQPMMSDAQAAYIRRLVATVLHTPSLYVEQRALAIRHQAVVDAGPAAMLTMVEAHDIISDLRATLGFEVFTLADVGIRQLEQLADPEGDRVRDRRRALPQSVLP